MNRDYRDKHNQKKTRDKRKKNLGKWTGTTETSITKRKQEIEERISDD